MSLDIRKYDLDFFFIFVELYPNVIFFSEIFSEYLQILGQPQN